MATEWFIQRGEKTSGPFSSKQLKSLAKSGRLKTEYLVRKGSEGKFFPITRLQGLFDSPVEEEWSVEDDAPVEEEWSVESPEDSVEVCFAEADEKVIAEQNARNVEYLGAQTSIEDEPRNSSIPSKNMFATLKQKAAVLASHVKTATKKTAKMSSLKFEETTLSTTTLPGFYAKLGKAVCQQCPDQTPAEIQTQREKIAELDRQAETAGTPTTLLGKAKSMAAAGTAVTQRVILQQQLGRMYAAFGQKNFEADEQGCEPQEITQQITAARKRLNDIRQENAILGDEFSAQMTVGTNTLTNSSMWRLFTSPFRVASGKAWGWAGALVFVVILFAPLFSQRMSTQTRPPNADQGSQPQNRTLSKALKPKLIHEPYTYIEMPQLPSERIIDSSKHPPHEKKSGEVVVPDISKVDFMNGPNGTPIERVEYRRGEQLTQYGHFYRNKAGRAVYHGQWFMYQPHGNSSSIYVHGALKSSTNWDGDGNQVDSSVFKGDGDHHQVVYEYYDPKRAEIKAIRRYAQVRYLRIDNGFKTQRVQHGLSVGYFGNRAWRRGDNAQVFKEEFYDNGQCVGDAVYDRQGNKVVQHGRFVP